LRPDVAGANTVDGTMAYRNLRETNDPYDPKLRRDPIGIANVGAPIAADKNGKGDTSTTEQH
jgi:hypothetical protein